MKSCERETQVIAQAIRGEIPESVFRHLDVCPHCFEAVTAVRELQLLADEPFPAPLPAATFVWWKATVQKHQAAGRHTRIPLICMEWIACAVGLLFAITIAIRTAPAAVSLPALLWIGLGIIGTTCLSVACTLYAWSRLDS